MSNPDERAPHEIEDGSLTSGHDYAERLRTLDSTRWKQMLDVQRPYRWNLARLGLGRTLDIGCGIGRNLRNLGPHSVGVDHNPESIALARSAGLEAHTTTEFWGTGLGSEGAFDSLLVAHVLEHVSEKVGDEIVSEYLPCLRPGGQVVFITPQEAGYRSDATHIRFVGFEESRAHAERLGLSVTRSYSFPFPRAVGKIFAYNEFVVVSTKSTPPTTL